MSVANGNHHDTPSSTSSGNGLLLANGQHALSCVTCARRKVKCDRVEPCSNCQKHGIACEYREAAPKGRKRKAPDATSADMRARLEKYEAMLADMGVDLPAVEVPAEAERPTPTNVRTSAAKKESSSKSTSAPCDGHVPSGRLVVHHGKSRYVQGNLWTKMGDEEKDALLEDLSDEDEDNDDDTAFQPVPEGHEGADLVMGTSPKTTSLRNLYPPPVHFTKLWQAFIANVHPLCMILHGPTHKQILFDAVKDPDNVPRDVEALLFSVVACAVISSDDDECIKHYNEQRASLLARARYGARQALVNAKFLLSSNFTVLQALFLYLLAIRPQLDPRAMWNLTGIATRNAQRLGLHQDKTTTGLTPFEIQMRRRMWYQIVLMDMMAAQVAGTAIAPNFAAEPLTPPTNLNDTDLHPDMKELPPERIGATEMIFCRLRLKVFQWMQKLHAGASQIHVLDGLWPAKMEKQTDGEKTRFIDEVEREIELEILRYCDLLNPVHLLTARVARLMLSKMRFSAYHPRNLQSRNECSQETKNYLYLMALRVIQYDNQAHGETLTKRFLWHSHAHFQWSCLLHILDELKTRTLGEDAETGWTNVNLAYSHRPEITTGKKLKLPLYLAVHKMTLDAWSCRERAAAEAGEEIDVPDCVQTIRRRLDSNGQLRRTESMDANTTPSSLFTGNSYPTPGSGVGCYGAFGKAGQGQGWYGGQEGQSPHGYDMFMSAGGQFGLNPNDERNVDWSAFDTVLNMEGMAGVGGYFDEGAFAGQGGWGMGGGQSSF